MITETEPVTSWALINRLGYDQYTVTNIYAQFMPKLDLSFITPGLSISGSYGYQTNAVKGLFVNRTYEGWVRTGIIASWSSRKSAPRLTHRCNTDPAQVSITT